MSWVRRRRWKSNVVKPGEDRQPEDRVDQLAVRDLDEDQDDPEDDQRDQRPEAEASDRREVAPGRVARGAESGDEQRGRAARLPQGLRVRARRSRRSSVRGRARSGAPNAKSSPIASCSDRCGRDVDGRAGTPNAAMNRDHAPPRQVAAEVGAQGEEGRGNRDEAHRLAEQGPAPRRGSATAGGPGVRVHLADPLVWSRLAQRPECGPDLVARRAPAPPRRRSGRPCRPR